MDNKVDLIKLSLVNVYWGITTILMKHALLYMNSSTYVGLRMLIGAVFIVLFSKKIKLDIKTIIYGVILGLLLVLNMEILVLGLNYTSATNSVFISQLTLVVVPLMYCLIYKQKPAKNLVITIVIMLAGLAILSNTYNNGFNAGDLLTLISVICNSIGIILASSFTKECSTNDLSFVRLVFAGMVCFIISLFTKFSISVNLYSMMILFLTGFIGTGLAYTMQLESQKNLTPLTVSIIGILNPIFGMIGAAIIADTNGVVETMSANKIIGAIIIIMALVYYFKKS